jgi:hypothetical protein
MFDNMVRSFPLDCGTFLPFIQMGAIKLECLSTGIFSYYSNIQMYVRDAPLGKVVVVAGINKL